MNVLIVARTRMGNSWRCIGGLAADGRSVRLLRADGTNHDSSVRFRIGQIWDLTYTPSAHPVPPHVEDVIVTSERYVRVQPNLRAHILRRVRPWRGGIDRIFGGLVRYTGSGNGYISRAGGVPDRSTWFWIPDRDLHLRDDGKHYDYGTGFRRRGLSYVGEAPKIERIQAGTLVRVSLARWWKPEDAPPELEERCYLQLSGWF